MNLPWLRISLVKKLYGDSLRKKTDVPCHLSVIPVDIVKDALFLIIKITA